MFQAEKIQFRTVFDQAADSSGVFCTLAYGVRVRTCAFMCPGVTTGLGKSGICLEGCAQHVNNRAYAYARISKCVTSVKKHRVNCCSGITQ
jgi:hypothetical protein